MIGAGAAGCVVAARLSEDPRNDVAVLEAGPDHGSNADPCDRGPFLADPDRIRTDAIVVRRPGGPPVTYPQGFGVGGSSLINGSVAVPGADLEPSLLPLEPPWALGAIGEALLAASPVARSLLLVRRDRVRVTVADAYLRPALDRPNLTLVTGTPVVRLIVDDRRIVGVVAADGSEHTADRVAVCAGAIQTPALLLRSGLDTPGIGRGLQDHPGLAIALDLHPGSIDATAPAITVSAELPGGQILGMNHLPDSASMGALLAGLNSVTSTGRVTLPDPEGPPLVELDQLTTDSDRDGLAAIALGALALLEHPAMRSAVRAAYVDDHGTPAGRIAGDPTAVRAWLPDHLAGYHHVAASCRMGVVTDELGRVVGYDGLSLCDASIFQRVPPANPYLSVIALAERLVAGWRAVGS